MKQIAQSTLKRIAYGIILCLAGYGATKLYINIVACNGLNGIIKDLG